MKKSLIIKKLDCKSFFAVLLALVFVALPALSLAASVPPELGDNVKVEKVKFKNRFGIEIVADVYSPKKMDSGKKYPAIAIGHPFGGVKEQTASLHAKLLAEYGYVALAYDAAFYGESGGIVRNTESPDMRVEDFNAAVDYLSNLKYVDPNRIGILGLCGGGGYAIAAAKIDPRIKAMATVSYVEMGERTRNQSVAPNKKLSVQERQKVLQTIADQRTKDFAADKTHYVSNIPTKGPHEFYKYYRTERGKHARATTDYALAGNAGLMNFYPLEDIEMISPRPILFIIGENSLTPKKPKEEAPTGHFSQVAYDKAAEPKELFIVPNASHVDLYDNLEYMKVSIDKLDKFFKNYLK